MNQQEQNYQQQQPQQSTLGVNGLCVLFFLEHKTSCGNKLKVEDQIEDQDHYDL